MLTGLCSSITQGPWHLIFDLGQLGILSFCIEVICWTPWISPYCRMFLGAQHSLIMQSVHSSPFNIFCLYAVFRWMFIAASVNWKQLIMENL